MGYHFQNSHAIAVKKQEIIREISHRQHPTLTLDQNYYRRDSP